MSRLPLLLAAALTAPAYAQAPDVAIQAQPLPPPNLAQAEPSASPQAAGPQWLPRSAAELQVLDKLEAVSRNLTVPVGQSARFGSLTITVKACDVRQPDREQDAAAFLSIADSRPDEAGFQGWMLRNEPWLDMMQSSLYDVRVVGCS